MSAAFSLPDLIEKYRYKPEPYHVVFSTYGLRALADETIRKGTLDDWLEMIRVVPQYRNWFRYAAEPSIQLAVSLGRNDICEWFTLYYLANGSEFAPYLMNILRATIAKFRAMKVLPCMLLIITHLILDGYYMCASQRASNGGCIHGRQVKKFVTIMERLPSDLQEVVCLRAYGNAADFVTEQQRTFAKSLLVI
jgi:hypothetical protein